MSEVTLEWRLGMLERRLSHVEEYLRLPLAESLAGPEAVPESVPAQPPSLADHLLHLRATAQTEWPSSVPWAEPAHTPAVPPPLPPLQPPQAVLPYAPFPRKPAPAQTALEQAIGLKWAGWIGAIILVIGSGLGIKFAYDQGWFSAIPDSAKLILMSLGGFALIGAGEWVYRRVNRLSAAGLFGAGVAIFFLVSYAGFGFYSLYARNTAFILMGLSTIAGAVVARRGNLVSIAVLSLIGGNLAPILLRGPTPDLPAFFAYLLMLQTVALVLAGWSGESKWWTLRGLSLAGNAIWIFGLTLSFREGQSHASQGMFLVLSFLLYQVELIASAWRGLHVTQKELANPGVLFSTLVTAGFTAAFLVLLQLSPDSSRGMIVLSTSAACAACGFLLPSRKNPALGALRIGYRIQAAVLLVVAVPVLFSGASIDLGWLALAIAFAAMAWSLDLSIARYAGVVTWGLAAAHLGWRWGMAGVAGGRSIAFSDVPSDLVLAAMISVVGHGIAWLVGRARNGHVWNDHLRWFPTIAGTLAWVCACIGMMPPIEATFLIVLYAWLMLAVDFLTNELGAAMQAVAMLMAATAKWVFVDLLAERLSSQWSPALHAAVFNPAMGVGLLIAISLVALFWLRREVLLTTLKRIGFAGVDERESILFLAALVIGLMSIGLSFEIDHILERRALQGGTAFWPIAQIKQLALTMLWSVSCTCQLLLARYVEPSVERRQAWLRRIGSILTLLAIKFLLLDTLSFRFGSGAAHAMVFFNLLTLAAAVVLASQAAVCFIANECKLIRSRRIAGFLIVLILLWTGLLEIDRAFENLAIGGSMTFTQARFAKQVAMSIFGAVYAILSVIAGFRFRSAPVRYLGLALFGLTSLKVVIIDLANAGQGYRVLSFLALGLLLLGTSVLYGKLSPKLLK